MGALRKPRLLTAKEYLTIERDAPFKSEFYEGVMYPLGGPPESMAGGSPRHARIISNIHVQLGTKLAGRPCVPYGSDLRVKAPGANLYTYPDIFVVCGPLRFDPDDDRQETVTNPTVLVEVLSPSTNDYDRTTKAEFYRRIDTLRHCLLVAQDSPRIEHWALGPATASANGNHGDGLPWTWTEVAGLAARVTLTAIGCELTLAEIYAGTD